MNNKRESLKKITGASAIVALVPNSWTKPIVSSVLLPAHAQTSTDETLPTIQVDTSPIRLGVGDTLMPPEATCTDDVDSACSVEVDVSGVDINTVGSYEIVYTAIDSAGNIAEARVSVEVVSNSVTLNISPVNCGITEEEIILYTLVDGAPPSFQQTILASGPASLDPDSFFVQRVSTITNAQSADLFIGIFFDDNGNPSLFGHQTNVCGTGLTGTTTGNATTVFSNNGFVLISNGVTYTASPPMFVSSPNSIEVESIEFVKT